MTKDDVHTATFSYVSFKLFHLSILFRASVSSNPMFQAIRLGMHEDRIRKCCSAKCWTSMGSIRFWTFAVISTLTTKLKGHFPTNCGTGDGHRMAKFMEVRCGGYLPVAR